MPRRKAMKKCFCRTRESASGKGSPRGRPLGSKYFLRGQCPRKKTAMPWGSMITCIIAGGSPPCRFSASNVRKRSFTLREACNSRREQSASLINSVGPYEACVPRTSQSFNFHFVRRPCGRDARRQNDRAPSFYPGRTEIIPLRPPR